MGAMSGRIASLMLCLVVGLAPLALGSNRPLPWAYNALFSGVCCIVVAAVLQFLPRRYPQLRLGIITPSLLLWTIAIAWALAQVVPLGASSLTHPSWTFLAQTLTDNVPGRVSVSPHDSLASIARLLTYVAVFLSCFVLARDPDNAGVLLRGFIVFAYLYAIYGLARYSQASAKILWFDMVPSGSLSSTFINRNSAATYFGLASCGQYSFLQVFIAGTLGALVGDIFGFFIGRIFRETVKNYRYYQLAQPRIENLVNKFGGFAIIVSKYIYGIRVAMCIFNGISMPFWRYLLLDAVSCAVWVLMLAGLGYFFGGAITTIIGDFHQIGILLGIVAVVGVIGFYLMERFWLSKKVEEANPETIQKIEEKIHFIEEGDRKSTRLNSSHG